VAKVQFGSVVNDARNKTGGIVYSKNKYGSFIRRKVSPAQPRTDAQTAIRAGLTTTSKDWSGVLNDTERAAWAAFALSNPVHDQFGAAVILTGAQTYVRLNNAILHGGGSAITSPPADLTVSGVSAITAAGAAGTPALAISVLDPNPALAAEQYMIYATRQVSPGRASINSFYRYLQLAAYNATLPIDLLTAYTAKFGALVAGQKIGIGVRILNLSTGAQSQLFTTLITVAA
jgi:hypothetical protein